MSTQSIHIVPLLCLSFLFTLGSLHIDSSSKFIFSSGFLPTFTSLTLFSILFAYLFINPNLFARLDISSLSNLSLITWFYGLSGFLFALNTSPLLGFGAGSFGYTLNSHPLNNIVLDKFSSFGLTDPLCQYDGYSLFFRLSHDIGPLIFCSVCFLVLYKFYRHIAYMLPFLVHLNEFDTPYHIFFFKLLGLFLFVGALIKEPILTSFPFTFVPLFLL